MLELCPTSATFQRPPPPRPNRAAATSTCCLRVSASASHRPSSFLRSWSVKKGLWRHIPPVFALCPPSSSLSRLIFPLLSQFIVQRPLCAWTLFIHELVDTSVNEGKRRFYRLPLCVEGAVWTARPPFFGRMRRSLSALRVLWPFSSLSSLIRHFFLSLQLIFSLFRFLPLTLLKGHESADGDASDVFGLARAFRGAGVTAVARTLWKLCLCFQNLSVQECSSAHPIHPPHTAFMCRGRGDFTGCLTFQRSECKEERHKVAWRSETNSRWCVGQRGVCMFPK